jgi:glycosyltransferase involved in cell wall biosynthesis
MGRGLPAIVSDATGIADLLTHGCDALVVETGSVEALRDAIARVCDDPDELDRLGAEAVATARRRPWPLFERELGDVAEALIHEWVAKARSHTNDPEHRYDLAP